MLRKLLYSACLVILLSPVLLALSPTERAPLYDHLLDVNAQWQYISPTPDQMEPVSFENDTRRIQTHLLHVVAHLRSQPTQNLGPQKQQKREHLLHVLESYAKAAVFPKNYDFNKRIPYFIDAHNTACAVGYLIIADGHQELADMIMQNNNYQYLLDMQYPELNAWVSQSGFTAEELALIQPGYMGQTPFTTLPGAGTGTNGSVNVLFTDQQTQDLIVAGTFTEIDGAGGFNNIAIYTGSGWDDMAGGLNGTVHDVTIFNNQLYVAGEFSQSISSVGSEGIIKWNGTAWESVDMGATGLYGDVYVLQVFNGKLYMGGDFQLPTGALREHLNVMNDSVLELLPAYPTGPVHSMTIYKGQLIIGGDFTVTNGQTTVDNLAYLDSVYQLQPYQNGFNNPVLALAQFKDFLFVGGAQQTPDDTVMSALAYYSDSTGWADLSAVLQPGTVNSITSFYPNGDDLYVGGKYECCFNSIIMYSGTGLGKFSYQSGFGSFLMLSSFDEEVRTINYYDGDLVAGGSFDQIRYGTAGAGPVVTVDNLGGLAWQREGVTGIASPRSDLLIKSYPNPASDMIYFKVAGNMKPLSLTILNLRGQKVHEAILKNGELSISVATWPAGMYFYQVSNDAGEVSSQRFFVE